MQYDVIVAGFSLNSAEPPAKVLERVLGVSLEQAKALLRGFPITVLANAERVPAARVASLLNAAGAKVEIRESGRASMVSAPEPALAAPAAPAAPAAGVRAPAATVAGTGVAQAALAARAAAAKASPGASPGNAPEPVRAVAAAALGSATTEVGPGMARAAAVALASAATETGPGVATAAAAARDQAAARPARPAEPAPAQALTPERGPVELGLEAVAPAAAPAPAQVFRAPTAEAAPREPGPSPDRRAPVTAYKLGDLDLGPREAVAPARVSGLGNAGPEAAAAPAAAAARSAGGEGAASGGSMQGLGDGFDDEAEAPALELDRNADWRTSAAEEAALAARQAKAARARSTPEPKLVAAGAAEPGGPRASAPGAVTATAASTPPDEFVLTPRPWLPQLMRIVGPLLRLLAAVVGVLLLLLVFAYVRDAAAVSELLGRSTAAPVTSSAKLVLRRAAEIRAPLPAPRNPPGRTPKGAPPEPLPGNAQATLDPALRLVPGFLRAPVAALLRERVPGVIPVAVDWPEEEAELRRHAECLLVETGRADRSGGAAEQRVSDLLRTGRWLDVSLDVQRQLAEHMTQRLETPGTAQAFTPLCLDL